MLSIVDIKKELGNNLYIYPIHSDSIKGNSIDFHASQFGWSLRTKKKILDASGTHLVIPPHDTALIYTEEAIYTSPKIGGTCHSKVTLVCKGLGHIGTTLDSQYIGNCIIAVHNHADTSYSLRVGAEFVTFVFHYLTSSDYRDGQTSDNDPGHPRMLDGYEGKDEYIEWRDQNKWIVQQTLLYTKMINSDEYKNCKKDFELEQAKFNRKFWHNKIAKYFITAAALAVVFLLFCVPSYFVDWGQVSAVFRQITERVVLPLILAILSAEIIVDCKRN